MLAIFSTLVTSDNLFGITDCKSSLTFVGYWSFTAQALKQNKIRRRLFLNKTSLTRPSSLTKKDPSASDTNEAAYWDGTAEVGMGVKLWSARLIIVFPRRRADRRLRRSRPSDRKTRRRRRSNRRPRQLRRRLLRPPLLLLRSSGRRCCAFARIRWPASKIDS